MAELPEDCIANVLCFTDPREVCRLSIVSPELNHAAQSDAVWNKFLPSDYPSLISGSSSPLLLDLPTKKQLYFSLCDNPILIDGGKTCFSLEKSSGKKIYVISARSLSIVWAVDTPQYWTWNSDAESRFGETAELINVCWLEIRGKIKTSMLSAATTYGVYLVYKFGRRVYGFGGRHPPLEAEVRVADGGGTGKREFNVHKGKKREDGWLEIELGEYLKGGDGEGELKMNIMGIKGGHWKSGLIVEGVEIRPKLGDI